MTPILPFIQERLKSVEKEINDDLFLWLSGKKYPGLQFDGSLVLLYWGPYLEGHINKIIETAFTANRELAFEHDLDPANSANDASHASQEVTERILNKMADYDQRMRGKGYPNSIAKKNITETQQRYFKIIQVRAQNEIAFFNMPKKNTIKLPLTSDHGLYWFIKNCHWSIYIWLISGLLSLLLAAFVLGFGAARNETFSKLYDLFHNSTSIQPSTIPPIPQNKDNTTK